MFYDDLSVYPAFGGMVFTQEEGERIVEYLGPKNRNVIMQTGHGLLSLQAERSLRQLLCSSL